MMSVPNWGWQMSLRPEKEIQQISKINKWSRLSCCLMRSNLKSVVGNLAKSAIRSEGRTLPAKIHSWMEALEREERPANKMQNSRCRRKRRSSELYIKCCPFLINFY